MILTALSLALIVGWILVEVGLFFRDSAMGPTAVTGRWRERRHDRPEPMAGSGEV